MQACAFVLHLTRAEKRRSNARELKERCGLDAEIWPAVDGAAMPSSELAESVRKDIFDPPYPFALKTGEIGCFLSHRQIWAEIVRRDLDYGVVFEDDVTLDVDIFERALNLAQEHIDELGIIEFQNRPPEKRGQLIDRSGGCNLTLPVVTPLRLSAQMINTQAARLLLSKSEHFDRPADTFVQSHWFTGLQPAVIYPSGVSTISDQLDGSTIQHGKKTISERIRREIKRFRYRKAVNHFSRHSPFIRYSA